MARTFDEIAAAGQTVASLPLHDQVTWYTGLEAKGVPFYDSSPAAEFVRTRRQRQAFQAGVPPVTTKITLRGPGTEEVEITPSTKVSKPFASPRTLVIDGKEYQMSNIDQANAALQRVQDATAQVKAQSEKQTADAERLFKLEHDVTTGATASLAAEMTDQEVADKKKALGIAQDRFKTDVTPLIQQSLNAQGLLESGATSEALAKALAQSASQTTAEGVNSLMADTMKRYQPLQQSASADFSRGLGQNVFNQSSGIDALLQSIWMEGQTPDMSQTVPYQLGGLGAGVGAGLYQNYRRKNALAMLMRQGQGYSGGGYNAYGQNGYSPLDLSSTMSSQYAGGGSRRPIPF